MPSRNRVRSASTVAGGYDLAKLGASRGAAREFFAPRAATTVLLFGTWGHRSSSVYAASKRACDVFELVS